MSALVKARNAKVPIIIVDTRVDAKAAADAGVKTETFVGSDNYAGGKLAGEYLVKATGGKAHVGILEGIPGHETGDSRMRGFRDAVKGAAGVTIVASQPANWERDQGFNVFQNMLQAHPDIDSVFACSDLMALGAIEAIAAAGKTGTIKRDRLRRARRCEEGDRGGDDGGVGGAVPVGDGQGGGRKRREGDPGRNAPGGHQREARTRDEGQREMTSTGKAGWRLD